MKPAFASLATFATLAIPAVLLLAGCATPTYTAVSEKPATYQIECSGLTQNWRDCEKKAADLCGDNGYRILTTKTDGPPPPEGRIQSMIDKLVPGSKDRRTIIAACK